VLLVALVRPMVDVLVSARIPRGVAALVTVLAVIALVAGLVTVVGTQVVNGFPELQREAQAGVDEVRRWLAGPPLHLTTDQLAGYVDQVRQSVAGGRNQVVSGALAATVTAGHVVAGVFIALFSTYFFLAQGRAIWLWLVRLLPRAAHDPLDLAAQRGWVTLTSFVRATIVVALTDAVGIALGAAVLGVPLVVPLGVLVFLGAFIPVVGALVSGSVAVLIALVAVGPVKALIMLAVVIAVQQLEAHVLQPFLLGRAVSVHPLAVILGIAAGALVAGILGALFAVPFIATGNTMVLSLAGRTDAEPEEPAGPLADEPPVDDAGG
jgi:predicted PurR-regulated permease PerM